ncbi:NADH-ubiquinone oxidoreductase-F iron-sulfur binding region domain-containing protein [Kitasatospora sp. NPDC018058]|uniref:NADH-ubiquinone oxidoreductase-F iron-sulfur binding region domain-containing protein n=1 Tax=Kitasatospora sp. NPDC018058 TaxID=3364025 RepID=UPI0037C0FC08
MTAGTVDVPEVIRMGPPRLTAGLDQYIRMGYEAHLAVHGPLPRYGAPELVDLAQRIALAGKGGAAFPFARKLKAVIDSARRRRLPATVVVNATEGEPGSAKDRMLLARAPHLVLDGALLVGEALRADGIAVGVDEGSPGVTSMPAAVAERRSRLPIRVVQQPARFVSGESGALIRGVNGLVALPPSRKVRSSDGGLGGVDGLPTLLSNAETYAQLAVAARLGAEAYCAVGPDAEPGTVLLTVNRPGARRPVVVEAPAGTPLGAVLDACGTGPGQGVLVGGYHGMFLDTQSAVTAPCSRAGMRQSGGTFGAGIVIPLPEDACPLGEAYRIVQWLAAESAGQCGPCRRGLPELARAFGAMVAGGGARAVEEVRRLAAAVVGQGACAHPDGSAGFVRSALSAFPEDVRAHTEGAGCGRRVRALLPTVPWSPDRDIGEVGRVNLTVDWALCDGHGLCADIAPELFTLDRHGFPVVSEGPVPVWLTLSAKRAVNQCPALALRFAVSGR